MGVDLSAYAKIHRGRVMQSLDNESDERVRCGACYGVCVCLPSCLCVCVCVCVLRALRY